MGWKRGQSGNPAGRAPAPVTVPINPEPVYIPILKRRDPANELVKLADSSDSVKFKKDIWTFLFLQKYRAANIVPNATLAVPLDAQTDQELLATLEAQPVSRRVKSKPRPLERDQEETMPGIDTNSL